MKQSAARQRGADALARAIVAAGVTRVFTLSGNHIMPVFDAALDAGIELIHVRHEAAAVHMADAYARLTGKIGVALVTGGPGHANAVSALYTAGMAESPVVLLSGHAPNAELGMGAFQEMRQADVASPLVKGAWTSASPDSVATDFANAARTARAGRPGPVHLSLPTDALERAASHQDPRDAFTPEASLLPDRIANAIIEAVSHARRPLVLTGPACMTKPGRAKSEALEAAWGVPVVGMESPRGIFDPSLGAFAEIVAEADLVVLLGKRLDFTLQFGKAFAAACRFIHVDPEAHELERSARALGERLNATAIADTFASIEMLASRVREVRSGWRSEARDAIAFRPPSWNSAPAGSGRLHPVQMLRPLQTLLNGHPDAVFVSDGGEIGQWAQACLTAPHRVINGVAGSIGAGLPFALGCRVAQPEAPIVAVMGDGTFGFHCAEIDTGVRYDLPCVVIVGNDARWNAEYQIQLRDYGPERLVGCELLPTRYDEVARAFGGFGEVVTEAGEMLPAAERAQSSGLPAVLNVMIEGLPAPKVKLESK